MSHAADAFLETFVALLMLQGVTVVDLIEFRPGGMCNSKRIPFRVRAVASAHATYAHRPAFLPRLSGVQGEGVGKGRRCRVVGVGNTRDKHTPRKIFTP